MTARYFIFSYPDPVRTLTLERFTRGVLCSQPPHHHVVIVGVVWIGETEYGIKFATRPPILNSAPGCCCFSYCHPLPSPSILLLRPH